MKKLLFVILVFLLMVSSGCSQDLLPPPETDVTTETKQMNAEHTQPSNPSTVTEEPVPTEQAEPPDTDPTAATVSKPCVFIRFMSEVGIENYEKWYGDVSACKDGFYYSVNGQTGEIVELYDDSLLFSHVSPWTNEETAGNHAFHYAYYVTKQERNRIYRLNCTGTAKDELIYESPNGDFQEFGFSVSKGIDCREVLLVLEENRRVLEVDTQTGASKILFTYDEYIDSIQGYFMDSSNESYYLIFMDREKYSYRYDLATGEIKSTGVI